MEILDALKLITESSKSLMDWGLALLGGSILAILSTSYMRPSRLEIRCAYLLFVPAWIVVGLSLNFGKTIEQRYIAAALNPDNSKKVLELVNSDYIDQLNMLSWGVGLLILWLAIYLLWWIFGGTVERR